MTLTRLFQCGFELQDVDEIGHLLTYGSAKGSISTTSGTMKTGSASYLHTTASYPVGHAFSSTTQIAGGVFFRYGGTVGSANAHLILFITTGDIEIFVGVNTSTGNLNLVVNGTIQDSVVFTSAIPLTDTYYAIGISIKADATNGWVYFYIDGVETLSFNGNTGTFLTGLYCGGDRSGAIGWGTLYVDDFYVDDAVGESFYAPSSPRFSFLLVNGAGTVTDFTPSAGSNYQNVDDSGTPDDDTTYNSAASSGLQDSYALADTVASVTVPVGLSVAAVIPIAWVKKSDAGTASTAKIGTRESGGTELLGSAQTLGTSYGAIWDRQSTKPSGGVWSESDIDGAQVMIESAGSY